VHTDFEKLEGILVSSQKCKTYLSNRENQLKKARSK